MLKEILKQIKYIAKVFRLNLDKWMVYRLKVVVWIVSGIVEPIIWSVLWYVTAEKSEDLVMNGAQVLSYYLFASLMSRITRSWTFDTVRKQVLTGKYTRFLLWPKGIIGFRIGADWSNRIVTVAVLLPLWIVWLLILLSKGLLSLEFSNILLFLAAVLLAIFVRFFLDMVLGHIALFFIKIEGISHLYWAAARLFGGMTVPLILLPSVGYWITKRMPFRYGFSFPVEVFQGIISKQEILDGFIWGGVWLVIEIVILMVIFRFGLKKYEAVGI